MDKKEVKRQDLEMLEVVGVTYSTDTNIRYPLKELLEQGAFPGVCDGAEGERAKKILAECDVRGMFNPSKLFPFSWPEEIYSKGRVLQINYGIRNPNRGDEFDPVFLEKASLSFEEYVDMEKPSQLEKEIIVTLRSK